MVALRLQRLEAVSHPERALREATVKHGGINPPLHGMSATPPRLVRPVSSLRMVAGRNVRGRRGRFLAGHPFRVPRTEIVRVAVRAIMRAQIQHAAHEPFRDSFALDAIGLRRLAEGASTLARDSMAPHKNTPTLFRLNGNLVPGPGAGPRHSEPIPSNLHTLIRCG